MKTDRCQTFCQEIKQRAGVGRSRLWCSECRPRKYRKLCEADRDARCDVCGVGFKCAKGRSGSGTNRQRYCSTKCAYEAEQNRIPFRLCSVCGHQYKPHRGGKISRSEYCSGACRAIGEGKKRTLKHEKPSIYMRFLLQFKELSRCRMCGLWSFNLFCSRECNKAFNLSHRHEMAIQKYLETCGSVRCYQCATEFIPEFKRGRRTKFCSDNCQRRFTRRQNRRRRRLRKWQTEYLFDRFGDWEIFERDHWVCQICHLPVRREVDANHNQAPTIDHIFPISRGGSHRRDNVWCTHRICNTLKNEMLPTQLGYALLLQKINDQRALQGRAG